MVAVACTEAAGFNERVERLGQSQASAVLIWSMRDPLRPHLVLHSPGEVFALQANPCTPNILAGGIFDGQVVLWDISQTLVSSPHQSASLPPPPAPPPPPPCMAGWGGLMYAHPKGFFASLAAVSLDAVHQSTSPDACGHKHENACTALTLFVILFTSAAGLRCARLDFDARQRQPAHWLQMH